MLIKDIFSKIETINKEIVQCDNLIEMYNIKKYLYQGNWKK
jgi:hypothetical protein